MVSGLVLEFPLVSAQEWEFALVQVFQLPSVSEWLMAIRFRSWRSSRRAFLLWSHPFSNGWVSVQPSGALLTPTPLFLFRLWRDLPRHPTTQCFLDSMRPSLPHSSESVRR